MSQTASDVMSTKLITVTPSTSIMEFARTCTEDGISGAPVVQVDGTLVGVVSKTDIVNHMLDEDPRFGTVEDAPSWAEEREVQDIMQTDVLTVAPDTPVADIAERMAEDRIHRVLVLDRGKLVGIVTSIDLLAYYPK